MIILCIFNLYEEEEKSVLKLVDLRIKYKLEFLCVRVF